MTTAATRRFAGAARAFAAELERRFALPVELVDERYSSLEANAAAQGAARERHAPAARRQGATSTARPPRSSSSAGFGARRGESTMTRTAAARDGVAPPPADPRGAHRGRRSSALLERSQPFVRPLGERPPLSTALAGVHRRQPVHRTLDAHARVVRARRQAPRRRGREPRGAAVLARQGREHARHHLHAGGAARRRARDPRCRGRRAWRWWPPTSPPHVSVLSAGEAHVSHPTQGLLDALTILPAQAALRRARGRHRRRHPPLARGALRLRTRCTTLGVARPAPGRARGADARGRTSSRAATRVRSIAKGIEGCRCGHDAAHPEGAHGDADMPDGDRVLRRATA